MTHSGARLTRIETEVEELEVLIEEGRGELEPVLAEWLATLAALYAEIEDVSHATLLYEDAFDRIQRVAAVAGNPEAIDAFLYVANEFAAFHANQGRNDRSQSMLDLAIENLVAHPELPPTLIHARLFLNRGIGRRFDQDRAIRDVERAIELYEHVRGTTTGACELASAWRARGVFTGTYERQRDDLARGVAVLEPLLGNPDARIRRELATGHAELGRLARDHHRFAEALPHQTRAVDLMYELVEAKENVADQATLARFRAARAMALAGARIYSAAIDEAEELLELTASAAYQQALRRQLPIDEAEESLELTGSEAYQQALRKRLPIWREARELELKRAAAGIGTKTLECEFCGRHRDAVAHLIAGPEVSICNLCVADFVQLIVAEAPVAPHACRFCTEPCTRSIRREVTICSDCIELCREIIAEQSASPATSSSPAAPDEVDADGRKIACGFCEKPRREVQWLVEGNDIWLCDECFGQMFEALESKYPRDATGGRTGRSHRFKKNRACSWCASDHGLMLIGADAAAVPVALCDRCIDRAAPQFPAPELEE